MELVQGDAHTFDCWVQVELDGKKTAVRPYLVGLIDTRSRVLVGWAICTCPNNRIIKKMLMHMMYPKENSPVQGVPRIILIDNGKDWTAQALTGRSRTERISLDGEIRGFYKSIGIDDDMRALPYQPWTKAQIERFFGTLTNKFAKSFESYTGTLTAQYTTSKIKKDIPKMLEAGNLISIDEFAKHFEQWINEKYHNREHSGLKKQKEENPTPFAVWQNADRYMKAAPPIDYARMLLLSVEERCVYPTGFKLHNNTYQHQLLGKYIDQYIDVRFDPEDMEIVYAYSKDGKKICEVKANQLLNPLANKEDEFLEEHIRGQKRHMKATKSQLENLTKTYEERQAQPVMLPELSGEEQTVVALPQDKQYQEEVKERKKKQQQQDEINKNAFVDIGKQAYAMLKNKKVGGM
jgi:transposase InsO family protein